MLQFFLGDVVSLPLFLQMRPYVHKTLIIYRSMLRYYVKREKNNAR